MPGYSGTPLPQKLGIKEGSTVLLLDAPADFESELAPLPGGVELLREPVSELDVALLFVTQRADLERRFPAVATHMRPAGSLWVAWPKKSAPKRSNTVPTDLTEDVLREVVLPLGWVDNKVCAVTEVWSGLRFVLRLENRPRPTRG